MRGNWTPEELLIHPSDVPDRIANGARAVGSRWRARCHLCMELNRLLPESHHGSWRDLGVTSDCLCCPGFYILYGARVLSIGRLPALGGFGRVFIAPVRHSGDEDPVKISGSRLVICRGLNRAFKIGSRTDCLDRVF